MLHALHLDSNKNERGLLKALKPVRKKAGKVRDMDVLTGFASQLHTNRDHECLVRLLCTCVTDASFLSFFSDFRNLPGCFDSESTSRGMTL